jgi:uncharacterized protein YbjT (DUF2867 family)
MILVTGATGTIGRALLTRLIASDQPIRALTRNVARVRADPHVQPVQGDLADPESLDRAMKGVSAAFLLSPGGPASIDADRALVDAARRAGVSKLVKLSSIGAGARFTAEADWHTPGEQAVRATDMAWTLLRPSAYAANALRWAPAIGARQPVPNLTGTATQGIVDERDIAEIAAQALTTADHDDQTYTLTGPELLSAADQAARLGEALGRAVTTVDVPLDVAREQMLDSGMDNGFVDAALRGLQIIADGHNAILTDDVQRVLGRPPTSFAVWAQDHRASFDTAER